MALFQLLGIVEFVILCPMNEYNNPSFATMFQRAQQDALTQYKDLCPIVGRYGIIASPSSFRISPEMLSGLTDLFLPITSNIFLMILVLISRGSHMLGSCICDMLCSLLNTKEQ
jgi:hypothetical protein